MSSTRSPICTVVGHVDHGKSTLLDRIRGSSIVNAEPGKITQAIGASIVPISTIRNVCAPVMSLLKMDISVNGLLFIDTPGHAAFTNLRKRGGTLADIAALVVDINEGFKPQTKEAIEMLKQFKVPFIVIANKIDLLSGWKIEKEDDCFLTALNAQAENTKQLLDKKIYELVGKLFEYGFNSERFDRVEDYTKQIAIVPASAKFGVGIPEMLMVLAGMAKKYLEKKLMLDVSGPAKGTVLEIKDLKGMGCCADVIVYDGILRVNDIVVFGGMEAPVATKVKAIFEPEPLKETRDKKSKFNPVKEVVAASAVRISAPEFDKIVAGMPMRVASDENLEEIKELVQKEVNEVIIETDKEGIVIKADTLGSLEALKVLLKEKGILIRKAGIGDISKKDISDTESNYEEDPLQSVILGFNVKLMTDVPENEKVKIFTNNVIYKIIEDFEKWQAGQSRMIEEKEVDALVRPCKIELMKNYVFRQSNPAIMGVEITVGKLKVGMPLMKDGKTITQVKSIQHEKESVNAAEQGKQVALAMEGVMVGRQINEGDILYSAIPEDDFRKLKELKKYLTPAETAVIKEIAVIMRKTSPVWGV